MSAHATVQKQYDALTRHDAAAFAACYASDAVVVDPQYPEPLRGTEAIRKDVADFIVSFPDLTAKIDTPIADGSRSATTATMTGTHQGPLVGPDGVIPATNKRMEVGLCTVSTFNDQGLIVEERRYYDLAGLLGQLGLMR